MPVELPFTALLNHYFAGVANAVLALLHVHPKYPQRPIDNIFAMEFLVFLVLLAFFALVRVTLSVEKPGPPQHIAEMIRYLANHQNGDGGYGLHIEGHSTMFGTALRWVHVAHRIRQVCHQAELRNSVGSSCIWPVCECPPTSAWHVSSRAAVSSKPGCRA